jgi:hypothetical protein
VCGAIKRLCVSVLKHCRVESFTLHSLLFKISSLSPELLPLISMAVSVFKMLGFFVGFFLIVGLVSSAKFDELFQPSWALDHFAYEGELLRLKLDNYSGK